MPKRRRTKSKTDLSPTQDPPRRRYSRDEMLELKMVELRKEGKSRRQEARSKRSDSHSGAQSSTEGHTEPQAKPREKKKGSAKPPSPIKRNKSKRSEVEERDAIRDRLRASLSRSSATNSSVTSLPTVQHPPFQSVTTTTGNGERQLPRPSVQQTHSHPQQLVYHQQIPRPGYAMMGPGVNYMPSLISRAPPASVAFVPYPVYQTGQLYQQVPNVMAGGQLQLAHSFPVGSSTSAAAAYSSFVPAYPSTIGTRAYSLPQGRLLMPTAQPSHFDKLHPRSLGRRGSEHCEELPEWMNGGPLDAEDTIELQGFDIGVNEGEKREKREPDMGFPPPQQQTQHDEKEDSDSEVVEFASKILDVKIDPPLAVGAKQRHEQLAASRMSQFFHRTPDGKTEEVGKKKTVETPRIRRLGQAGELLTQVDRPTTTPPVLRRLFADAGTEATEESGQLGDGVKADELEREMLSTSNSSISKLQKVHLVSTNPPRSPIVPCARPPAAVTLTEEEVRSTRAQLQYGWSPNKKMSNNSEATTAQTSHSYLSSSYQPGTQQRFLSVYQQPPHSSAHFFHGGYGGGVQCGGYGSSAPPHLFPSQQHSSGMAAQLLSNNPSLRAEFFDFLRSKMQAFHSGTVQESHQGVRAILSGEVGANAPQLGGLWNSGPFEDNYSVGEHDLATETTSNGGAAAECEEAKELHERMGSMGMR